LRTLQDFCIHNTVEWKFYEKMYFVEIFFCLFCNFQGLKSTRTRTQNREKQRSGLTRSIFWPINKINRKSVVHSSYEWGGPSDETWKTEAPCHIWCGTIKIPPCSKALSAEHRPKFCSPSPAMVTSPYKWKILVRDVKQ
jgi:hypothetical protein